MKITQMHNSTMTQMMGYLIVTDGGRLIVFDGGNRGDAAELARLVRGCGGHIDLWFLSHPHSDHEGALLEWIEKPELAEGISVGKILYSPVPEGFAPDSDDEWNDLNEFARVFPKCSYPAKALEGGELFTVDNVTVEVLWVPSSDMKSGMVNDLSVVCRLTEVLPGGREFAMIFLGDLWVRGGEDLLKQYADRPEKLRADAVQMAHHGQNGVDFPVYEAIMPTWAFWPTPDWLWLNMGGGRAGAGPFKTLVVRAWMEQLGAIPVNSFVGSPHTVFDTAEELRRMGK